MNGLQFLGVALMVGAVVVSVWSISSTIRAQLRGNRAPLGHARLRITVFGVIFIGIALVVLGSPVPPVFALAPLALAGLTFAFAFAVRPA